jgi:hypothetical protein
LNSYLPRDSIRFSHSLILLSSPFLLVMVELVAQHMIFNWNGNAIHSSVCPSPLDGATLKTVLFCYDLINTSFPHAPLGLLEVVPPGLPAMTSDPLKARNIFLRSQEKECEPEHHYMHPSLMYLTLLSSSFQIVLPVRPRSALCGSCSAIHWHIFSSSSEVNSFRLNFVSSVISDLRESTDLSPARRPPTFFVWVSVVNWSTPSSMHFFTQVKNSMFFLGYRLTRRAKLPRATSGSAKIISAATSSSVRNPPQYLENRLPTATLHRRRKVLTTIRSSNASTTFSLATLG